MQAKTIKENKLLLLMLVALAIGVIIYSCDGGGGGGSGGGLKIERKSKDKFTINSPVPGGATYETTDYSVPLSGTGFVWPNNANCDDIRPQQIDITWRNSANGATGSGTSSASCLCDMFGCVPHTRWSISHGLITLKIGVNEIKATGSAPGKKQSDSIRVMRREGATSITFTMAPGNMFYGITYPLEVTVLDSMNVPVPDQVIDWNSSDESIAGIASNNLPTNQQGVAKAEVSARAPGPIEIFAVISGTSISSSVALTVKEPSPEPSDPNSSLPTRPILLTPINNSVISQKAPQSCEGISLNPFALNIYFDWTDSSSPNGIAGYHLFSRPGGIEGFVTESEFAYLDCGSFVIDLNLYNWEWYVRAEDSLGNLGPFSEVGVFQFAPCRMDDGSTCR